MHAAPISTPLTAESSQPLHVRLGRSLRRDARWRVALFVGLCAGMATLAREVPENDPSSLARAIGRATGGVVQPQDVRWEPSSGVIDDLVFGRFALALSSETAGGPRDVYRVRVRVTPEGHPLGVTEAHDITQTPLGDDHALVVHGAHAAFATFAYGQEQSVTALDLSGEGQQNSAKTSLERLTSAVTNFQQTGTSDGIARFDVGFDSPGERVGLAVDEASLTIDFGDPSGVRHATLDLSRGELTTPTPGMHAEPARHLPKRFIFWAVDTVRAVPWIGPAPVAWLEEKVFALKDSLKQATFRKEGAQDELAATTPEVLGATVIGDDGAWPPTPLPSIWKSTEPGEGAWKAYSPAWMRRFAEGAPPAFFTTFVRPDESRPYSHVILVEMDTRQVELDMEAGTEDPKPLTGQHGPGRLPRDPAVLTRVVAAFNGAFKTEHGTYGMMVHKRVLLPPQPNAATVIVVKDGRAGFGNWGPAPTVGGLKNIKDDDIVSFRQNLDALVDGGEVNPTKRLLWGYTLPGSGMQTERSGLCVTRAGHMIYAWGDDASATALGKAMRTAGCDYGMHLDMNPHHTGFLFTTIHELKGHNYKSEALTPLMEIEHGSLHRVRGEGLLLRDDARARPAEGCSCNRLDRGRGHAARARVEPGHLDVEARRRDAHEPRRGPRALSHRRRHGRARLEDRLASSPRARRGEQEARRHVAHARRRGRRSGASPSARPRRRRKARAPHHRARLRRRGAPRRQGRRDVDRVDRGRGDRVARCRRDGASLDPPQRRDRVARGPPFFAQGRDDARGARHHLRRTGRLGAR